MSNNKLKLLETIYWVWNMIMIYLHKFIGKGKFEVKILIQNYEILKQNETYTKLNVNPFISAFNVKDYQIYLMVWCKFDQ